jgi:Rad3-related DNA helicase
VVAKVPFPSLGDRQVGMRLRSVGGQEWYNVQTIRKLVQMTGRGVRSEDDWCVTYIFDSLFMEKVYKAAKQLLPKWWLDAVEVVRARNYA